MKIVAMDVHREDITKIKLKSKKIVFSMVDRFHIKVI